MFLKASPDYRYTVNEEGTEFDIWLDRNLNPNSGLILAVLPVYSGYNYYLKHHTGEWDMTISVYNCHSNQLVNQHKASQKWDFAVDEFGD